VRLSAVEVTFDNCQHTINLVMSALDIDKSTQGNGIGKLEFENNALNNSVSVHSLVGK